MSPIHQAPTGPGDQPLTKKTTGTSEHSTFNIPTFLHNRRIRPCMHALKIPSDVIKTREKKSYGHHRKHLKVFKSELKLYSILHNADLQTEKRKETSYGTF